MVANVHRRRLPVSPESAAPLLGGLGGPMDLLWPRDRWPAMRLDRGLQPGSQGGHGPVRYRVITHVPGRRVWFRFEGPRGFHGGHGFELAPDGTGACVLTHRLEMDLGGLALLAWPLFYRPLHDALIEDALGRAFAWAGEAPAPAPRYGVWVRLLRRLLGLPG